ncbi:protein ENHANCED DISEASE RESISTANCE 2-like [Citrus sinensis]|uniref:Protein ENHANCED DISEASE RESISTANCE 2-like n=2 Tax=Citrus sinensis TaxID=2711 RepID=A0ACB8KF47_CITSI|nr:protein ENHANCED DISEASE RESISTANCE 2-like [Citrus sinensis]
MSFNTIADAVSTCHLVIAIQFSMSRSGFGAMLSAVYGFKIKSRLFDGIDSIVEDWIVDQMHIVRGSQLWGIDIYTDDFDLVAVLMQASYYLPTASPPLSAIQELRAIIWCYLCKIKGGGTIDLEPYLTHSSTMEPILAPMAVERTTTTRAATSVGLVAALEEEQADQIDLSCFSGNLRHDDRDNARDCWKLSDGNNFRVRSKHFCYDKTKIPAGKHLMDLVAVDWFKDTKRIDHVARRQGCAAQVASEKGLFSLIFNLQVSLFHFRRQLVMGSLLQRFVDGDDEFRNSRLKLIPSVPKGSWIVRQSVGSTPCSLGKAVNCNYIRGSKYLEVNALGISIIDVDIGSSTVANGVLGLVIGVITTLVVDMAFLVQANTTDELPERLIGAVHVSHIELKSAVVPKLEPEIS